MTNGAYSYGLLLFCFAISILGCAGTDPCNEVDHCTRNEDGDAVCQDGYVWEEPNDDTNYICVEAPPACGEQNEDACRAYSNHKNAVYVECGEPEPIENPVSTCIMPGNIQETSCVAWYECMIANTECNGDGVIVLGTSICGGDGWQCLEPCT